MLTIQSVEIGPEYKHGYGSGARPGYRGKVTLQIGDKAYDRVDVELTPDEVREVVALAVSKAAARLTLDPNAIDVEGAPGEHEPAPPRNGAVEVAAAEQEVA